MCDSRCDHRDSVPTPVAASLTVSKSVRGKVGVM